ncbi:MAG: hypothetical protein HW380_970 [Magnetococcales bacterium]|nr:hypothetical protein [Magnetococcales bacterium]HIJ83364.1 hypothetical protein [Magnetococcales bacterium]
MKTIFKKSTETITGILVGGVAVLTISSAFSFTVPHTFTNGTPADATQVNANFNALSDAVESPTLVSNGTVEIGDLLGFQGSSYSGMTHQGYLFQINNSGALAPITTAVPITATTTLQARWTAEIDKFEQLLLTNQGNGKYQIGFNTGVLYFDSVCSVTTDPPLGTVTNSQENIPSTYVTVPSIPPRHIFKVANDSGTYVYNADEATFAGVTQSFSFTPYFSATTNGTGSAQCLSFQSSYNGPWNGSSTTYSWTGTYPSTTVSTLLNGGPYFQAAPTANNQTTTGVPDIGFAPPITIEMR